MLKPFKTVKSNQFKNLIRDTEELNLKHETENMKSQINQKYTLLHENIMKVTDRNVPLKKLNKKELKRPKKTLDNKRHTHFS